MLLAMLACRVEFSPPGQGAAAPAGGQGGQEIAEVWVYTSMYQEVIDALKPLAEAELPGVRLQWFQSGSEKVAARWEAEQAAGGSRACLLATSDPGWYVDLSRRGLLLPYVTPKALGVLDVNRGWVQPDHAAFRISLMVLAGLSAPPPVSGGAAAGSIVAPPISYALLSDPLYKDRFSTGDPLSSGTTFTAVAALETALGPDWLPGLKRNGWVASGGSSAVMGRIQSGERPYGMLLLENLLSRPDPRVSWVIPEEGAVAVPGPLAIPRGCGEPAAAERVYDWLFGPSAQEQIVAGKMHSPLPEYPPPAGAPPLSEIRQLPLPADFYARAAAESEPRKQRLQQLLSGG